MSPITIEIDFCGGNCPVQAEGRINGEPFYFRARGEHWSLSVGADPVGDPRAQYIERFSSDQFAAGWMDVTTAYGLILRAACGIALATPKDGPGCRPAIETANEKGPQA